MTLATSATDRTPPPDEALNEQRWTAMIGKSSGALAGAEPFAIAVRTTGTSCRVGCPPGLLANTRDSA